MGEVIEDNINPQFERIDNQFKGVYQRLDRIEATMVTKSYLDDKLADSEGGLTVKLRKEDNKVNRLVSILKGKKVLARTDVKSLREIQVFPSIQRMR